MKSKIKQSIILLLLIAFLLSLAACGGGASSEDAGSDKGPASAASSPENEDGTDLSVTYQGPLSCTRWQTLEDGSEAQTIYDLTDEGQEDILSLLNRQQDWINDAPNCKADYEFKMATATVKYHSECGIFTDITNHRSFQLSEEEKAAFNRTIGADKSAEVASDGITEGDPLTLEDVIALSAKGAELTWADFEQYTHRDVGFGLIIYRYEIDENFYLLIGGGDVEAPPFYISLCARSTGEAIDLCAGDVETFISEYCGE